MGKKGSKSGNQTGILLGVGAAIVVCLLGVAGLTQMVLMEKVGERGVTIIVPALLFLSTLIGCQVASTRVGDAKKIGIAVTSGSLITVMLITGLVIDGEFNNALMHMGAVVLGGVLSCVLCLKKPTKGMRKKRHSR